MKKEAYGAEVRYEVLLPEVRLPYFQRALADLTSGVATIRRLD